MTSDPFQQCDVIKASSTTVCSLKSSISVLNHLRSDLEKIETAMTSYEQLNSSASSTAVGQEQILAIKQGKKDGGIKVVAKNNPVTSERLPAIYANQFIDNPGVARGNVAASVDTPDGDREWAGKVKDYVCYLDTPKIPPKANEARLCRHRSNSIFFSGTQTETDRSIHGMSMSGSETWGST